MSRISNYRSADQAGFIQALNNELDDLHREKDALKRSSFRIEDIKIFRFNETIVEHNLGLVPRSVTIEQNLALGGIWSAVFLTKRSTDRFIYLSGSVNTVVSVIARK